MKKLLIALVTVAVVGLGAYLAKDGQLPDADLYLCTCVPGGEEFEIYIVALNKE